MTEFSETLADHIARGVTQGHDDHHAASKDRRFAERTEWFENMEVELAAALRRIGIIDPTHPDHSETIRRLFGSIGLPENQTDFFLLIFTILGLVVTASQAAASGAADQIRQQTNVTDGFYLPSPDMIANLFARDYIREGLARDWFSRSGIQGEIRVAYERAGFNHLTPDQALGLWRLKRIEEPAVDQLLHDASLSDTEAAWFKSLRWQPPSAAFAAQAATQGQITREQLSYLLEQNGIDPVWAESIYETEGQTMPPQMANELFRRGYIELPEYEQILIESNLKNKYVPLMKDLRWRIPPMRQTISAFHNGSINREVAADYLSKLGFDESVQQWMLDSAAKSTGSAGKHLSMQQHLAAYEAQLESREDGVAALVAVGWSPHDIELEYDVADHRATIARQSRAANAVGTRYVGWKITRSEASNALDALAVPHPARDEALQAWDVQRETRTAHLTRADIHKAVNAGKMTHVDGIGRLRAMGYDEADADLVPFIDKWTV